MRMALKASVNGVDVGSLGRHRWVDFAQVRHAHTPCVVQFTYFRCMVARLQRYAGASRMACMAFTYPQRPTSGGSGDAELVATMEDSTFKLCPPAHLVS